MLWYDLEIAWRSPKSNQVLGPPQGIHMCNWVWISGTSLEISCSQTYTGVQRLSIVRWPWNLGKGNQNLIRFWGHSKASTHAIGCESVQPVLRYPAHKLGVTDGRTEGRGKNNKSPPEGGRLNDDLFFSSQNLIINDKIVFGVIIPSLRGATGI